MIITHPLLGRGCGPRERSNNQQDYHFSPFNKELEELITQAKDGNQDAAEKLIDRFRKIFGKTINKMSQINRKITKDELEQAMRIGVWNAIKTYEKDKSTPYYFITLQAYNKLSGLMKHMLTKKETIVNTRISTSNEHGEEKFILDSTPDNASSPDEIVIQRELLDMVINFAKPSSKNFSKFESLVFYGIFLKQLTYLEVAKALDVNPKSVDNAVSRIRRKLKVFLNKNYYA